MELADATLMHKAAEACWNADKVYLNADRIEAPKDFRDAAAENALQAGTLLNRVILRWPRTL